MEEKIETFSYTYSAKEQEEIKNIRNKYIPPTKEESPMERLRRLDASSTKSAALVSIIVGTGSTLLMGVGMCSALIPSWKPYFLPGIAVGILGIIGIISSHPLYTHMVKRKRAKLAPEIIRLSDELLK